MRDFRAARVAIFPLRNATNDDVAFLSTTANLAFGKRMANARSKELDATGQRESENGGALKNRKSLGGAFRID